jgi:hypothetical protein
MRKVVAVSTALFLLPLLANAAAAYGAQTPSSPSDPPAGSPSGSIYQLPLEEGRQDAAPKGSGGTAPPGAPPGGGGNDGGGSGSAGSEEAPSLYRSENNFGSSSEVPGAPGDGEVPRSDGSGPGSSGSGSGGSLSGHGGGGTGSAAASPGALTDSGNTSSAANIGLLLLIAALAIGIGVISVRARPLSHQR